MSAEILRDQLADLEEARERIIKGDGRIGLVITILADKNPDGTYQFWLRTQATYSHVLTAAALLLRQVGLNGVARGLGSGPTNTVLEMLNRPELKIETTPEGTTRQ